MEDTTETNNNIFTKGVIPWIGSGAGDRRDKMASYLDNIIAKTTQKTPLMLKYG